MGDFYDPEYPTESGIDEISAQEEKQSNPEAISLAELPACQQEEDNEAKNDASLAKGTFGKANPFKGLPSSRFLPKGTKAKVNLEEQGRQKVSFSFSLTKKTFQNRLLNSLGNDKQNESQSPSPAEHISKLKLDLNDFTGETEEQTLSKPKVELGKIHFKKHLLSVTNKLPAQPPPPPPPPASLPAPTSPVASTQATPVKQPSSPEHEEAPAIITLGLQSTNEIPPSVVPSQAILTKEVVQGTCDAKESSRSLTDSKGLDKKENSVVSNLETPNNQKVSEKADLSLLKESSHIGKDEKSPCSSQKPKLNPSPEKSSSKSKFSHSDGAVVGSESDEDSVQTSSSHKSHELKAATSKERDSKRSSVSLRSEDSGKYSSSRSKCTKDEKYSNYSKSDRDSRYSYSHSRSDRDRRRSRSRSRSHSRSRSDRGSKSSSSYSRSERSHYYDSDRRYHRSSPYRTRYSRSYADSRARDSSDSEDDHRRTHSRSSDSRRPSSSHSSSYRESRTSSYSKYDRDSKGDSSYDLDRRGRDTSRHERDFRRSSEKEPSKKASPRKASPKKEAEEKREWSHSKADNSGNAGSKSGSKQEHSNSVTKPSKWDMEKKPTQSAIEKEEHKKGKDEVLSSSNVKKTSFPAHQQTSPPYSKHSDHFTSSSPGPEFTQERDCSSQTAKKMLHTTSGSKYDDEDDDKQHKSPFQGIYNLSPSETWDLVTLSTTEDLEPEEHTTSSDNCRSDAYGKDSDDSQPSPHKVTKLHTRTNKISEDLQASKSTESPQKPKINELHPRTHKVSDDWQPRTHKVSDSSQHRTHKVCDDRSCKISDDLQPTTYKVSDDLQPRPHKTSDDLALRIHKNEDDPRTLKANEDSWTRTHKVSDNSQPRSHKESHNMQLRTHKASADTQTKTHKVSEDSQSRSYRVSEDSQSRSHKVSEDSQSRSHKVSEDSQSRSHKVSEDLQSRSLKLSEDSQPRSYKVSEDSQPRSYKVSEDSQPRSHKVSEDSQPRSHKVSEDSQPRSHKVSEDSQPRSHKVSEDSQSRSHKVSEDSQSRSHKVSEDSQSRSHKVSEDPQPKTPKKIDNQRPRTPEIIDDLQPSTPKETDNAQPRTFKETDDLQHRLPYAAEDMQQRSANASDNTHPKIPKEGEDPKPRTSKVNDGFQPKDHKDGNHLHSETNTIADSVDHDDSHPQTHILIDGSEPSTNEVFKINKPDTVGVQIPIEEVDLPHDSTEIKASIPVVEHLEKSLEQCEEVEVTLAKCPSRTLETDASEMLIDKYLEHVHKPETCHSVPECQSEMASVRTDPTTEEQNEFEMGQKGTAELLKASINLNQDLPGQVSGHLPEGISVAEETAISVAIPISENKNVVQSGNTTPFNVGADDSQGSSTPDTLGKESPSLDEPALVDIQATERKSIYSFEGIDQPSEAVDEETKLDKEVETKSELHLENCVTEEIQRDPTQTLNSKHEDFIGAINDFYSDSEDSESDTEDTDSDDSSLPRNRLQSVVVIPQNSTIANEELCRSPYESQTLSDSCETDVAESKSVSAEVVQKRVVDKECSPPAKSSDEVLEDLRAKALKESVSLPRRSVGVVSTSQPEVIARIRSGENHTEYKAEHETPTSTNRTGLQKENDKVELYKPSFDQSYQHSPSNSAKKPDFFKERLHHEPPKRAGDFSRADGFQSAEDLSGLGWDFSQPEKPSSTYQQPDSSYMYVDYNYQQAFGGAHVYRKDGDYWDPRAYEKGAQVMYSKPHGPAPDSVTHCYDEDDEDFGWDTDHGQTYPVQSELAYNESSSVQAHEISSNSTKMVVVAPKAIPEQPAKTSDRLDMKERGPPKKRRQELENDYENDLEALEKKHKMEAALKQDIASYLCNMDDFRDSQHWKDCSRQGKMPPFFDLIEENVYLTERKKSKSHRDIKRMQCECPVLSKEERAQGQVACGEDCLNRLLMIECSSRCPNGDYCSNRSFQKKQHAGVEAILTEKKGWGLRAAKDLKSNTFVLEYCGEVLDHKEFKSRVKEYARNKNIHYYFMALKNDEIIDATQKGNCSRFMNHSCDPNCETQKWTVNGQVRVGFFTTRVVPAGSELTFDYQFQRYGKEAQKCYCGAPNCRGILGGENRVSVRAAGGKMKKERPRKKDTVDGELEALLGNGEGLSDKNQVLSLSRLMVRIETVEQKLTCLRLLKNTQSQSYLKWFLDCHGLSVLWIWMAELGDSRGNTNNSIKLQLELIKTLEMLPIPNKNMLEESKILPIIQRWSQIKTAIPQLSEGDGYSSENTSRAHTPLNTPSNPTEPAAKLSVEADEETPKKIVLRRLKIISENSMDSAVSDAASEIEVKDVPEKTEVPSVVELKDAPLPKQEETKEELKPEGAVPPPVKEDPAATEEQKPIIKTEGDPGVDMCKLEPLDAEKKEGNGGKLDETSAVETPSQDEEEGVSDVESERSQEPADKILDMSDLATKLLESWKDLKEVYRIPKKTQVEKETNDRWRDSSGSTYTTPKSQGRERDRDLERQSQRKRRQSPSPPAYYGSKRVEDRYDTPASSKKKSRLQDRNKLSTEERRKLFEQEVAQKEAQKQQQQMQNMGIASPMTYEAIAYGAQLPPPPFIAYPQGYPLQSFVDPTNPNAGKVLLPTPPLDGIPSPNSFDPSQGMVVNPGMMPPQTVSVVQHVAAPMDVTTQQYVTQGETMVPQETNVAVLPVPAPTPVPPQNYGVWDPNQQAVTLQPPQQQSQPQYPPAPPQAAIYYQGQTCQPMYGVPAAYAQPPPPVVPTYTQQGLQYITGQQIYAPHPPGVVLQQGPAVTTIVAPGQPPAMQQPEMGMAQNNVLDLPPPSPPKPKTIVLPSGWKTARDPEGKIYYYHVITRQTQWDPPAWDSPGEEGGALEHEAEMDLGTPTYDENPMKSSKKTKTAEADTSSELAKKSKEVFRKEMSQFIVQCLNPYRKPDCKMGRINNTEDFKHLARKLTHGVMNKELKYCKNPEDLDCNENVKHKTKEYIKKYMQKFGTVYKPKEDIDIE
eukprot:XP_012820434.1 PREDICTED: histone-lysine N-methyltransferase SETD2 isoform X3 [Xenopus tropicalis]